MEEFTTTNSQKGCWQAWPSKNSAINERQESQVSQESHHRSKLNKGQAEPVNQSINNHILQFIHRPSNISPNHFNTHQEKCWSRTLNFAFTPRVEAAVKIQSSQVHYGDWWLLPHTAGVFLTNLPKQNQVCFSCISISLLIVTSSPSNLCEDLIVNKVFVVTYVSNGQLRSSS